MNQESTAKKIVTFQDVGGMVGWKVFESDGKTVWKQGRIFGTLEEAEMEALKIMGRARGAS